MRLIHAAFPHNSIKTALSRRHCILAVQYCRLFSSFISPLIFSNMVCLEADSEDVLVHKLDFDFKGTLINFGITLSHLPDKDYIEDFIF